MFDDVTGHFEEASLVLQRYESFLRTVTDLHFHDLGGTAVTMLFRAGCNIGEIVTITGHSLRRAQDILEKYLARTSQLAESAIAKFENVLETDFAKRSAKGGG
jgi:hypothetical protein